MDVVTDRLLTPVGLRSLAPGHLDYKARYYGDLRSRDAAYHQGTVWAWLIGPYVDAWRKLNPGKEIYGKDLTFKGGSHGTTLSIIPGEKAKEMESKLPEVPKSPSNHYANFLKACKGEEKARSPFEIAGPLSQVFNLGVLAQQLNTKIVFDREKKKITNNKLANQMLVGAPPRKGWEEFYKL